MAKYIMRRIVRIIPTILLLLLLLSFMISMIPGSTIDAMLAEKTINDPAARVALSKELGLDQPLPIRYLNYVGHVARGDFGRSLWSKKPVKDLIVQRVPTSASLASMAIILGASMGIVMGIISAVRQDSPTDLLLRTFATLGISVPNFAIATAVVVIPAMLWGITPNMRYVAFTTDPIGNLKILLLPALILSIGLSTSLMRLTRTTMLEVLRQDYIRTARAKGLRESNIIYKHALKNALIPVVTLLGLQISLLLSGSVIAETIFAIPGIGQLLLTSINIRDYPVVQGITLMIGLFVMATNVVVDISYAWLDPRINFS